MSKCNSISKEKEQLMKENQEYIENMLDFAINQLIEITNENDLLFIDDGKICKTYDDFFFYLKHWSQKKG